MDVFGVNFMSPIITLIYDLGIDLSNISNLYHGNYIAILIILVFAVIVFFYSLKFLYLLMSMFLGGWSF